MTEKLVEFPHPNKHMTVESALFEWQQAQEDIYCHHRDNTANRNQEAIEFLAQALERRRVAQMFFRIAVSKQPAENASQYHCNIFQTSL